MLFFSPPVQQLCGPQGVADYGNNAGHLVVLRLDTNGGKDFFVAFNRQSGINSDTRDYPDQVLITEKQDNDMSLLVEHLVQGGVHTIPNFGGSTDAVEIEVTEIDTSDTPAIARIHVGRQVNTAPLDVFFLVDTTGSFSDDLPDFKADATSIMNSIMAANVDTRFALGEFRDYPKSPYGATGDFAYELKVDFPSDPNDDNMVAVDTSIQALTIGNGADHPESQLAALYQMATGTGQTVTGCSACEIAEGQDATFRAGAIKVASVWTDSGFHDKATDSSYPGPTYLETITALNALRRRRSLQVGSGIRVVGVARDNNPEAIGNLTELGRDTNALATEPYDCNGDGVIDILEGEPIVCPGGRGGAIALAFEGVVKATVNAQKPVALCKEIDPLNTDEGECSYLGTISINNGSHIASGVSGGIISIGQEPPAAEYEYLVGTTKVTLKVTEEVNGLTSFCESQVTVLDKEKPKLLGVPSNATVECDSVPVPAGVTATDNCDALPRTLSHDNPVVQFTEVRSDDNILCPFDYRLKRFWYAEDTSGNSISKTQIIAVDDTTPPDISCNTHDIVPPDAPITFIPTALDNCGDVGVEILGFDCWKITKKGKRVDKTGSCEVELGGGSVTILKSGGVGTSISFTVTAWDECENIQEQVCELKVLNPGKNKKKQKANQGKNKGQK